MKKISIMIPCSIVSSFYSSLTPKLLVRGAWMVAAYTGTLTFCWLAGKILYRPFETSKKQVLNYATMISNAQFMGFPIVEAVLGEEGLVLAALAMIPGNIFTWTIALAQFTKINGKDGIKNTMACKNSPFIPDCSYKRANTLPAAIPFAKRTLRINGVPNALVPKSRITACTNKTETSFSEKASHNSPLWHFRKY